MQGHVIAFQNPVERFGELLRQLAQCPLITPGPPDGPGNDWQQQVREHCPSGNGIYVFHDNGTPKYVGRTNNMVRRLTGHRALWNEHLPGNSATFARILAKAAFKEHHHRKEDLFSLQLSQSFKELVPRPAETDV